ncbi:LOW QUALITY PROTEIN: probable RNA-binding protein EIF1AD [Vidua macroura]|uniref:LOW QUALITY PROTEIN: probable RNA-binding protein EIF1AD n=1 Tax=Vidua macroura TaxID=187451 RepID=UPI0023A7989D|nr:LOW QUALITY PROTEIN: probable RNA-binding protein EIF1AD [Vidua macroura]
MSRATKRKHVVRELLEERVQPGEGQSVVRVLGTPGNNLHEVETAEGTRFLASMPPRFRRHIWIKRGDFLLVDPILEGSKVKAEISLVLLPPHVRSLQRQGLWPEAFAPLERKNPREGDDQGLFVNTNRGGTPGDTGDSDGDSEEDTGDSDGDNENTGDSDEEDSEDNEEDTRDSDGDNEEDTGDSSEHGSRGHTGDTEDTSDTGDNAGTEAPQPKDNGDKDSGDRGDTGQGDAPQ